MLQHMRTRSCQLQQDTATVAKADQASQKGHRILCRPDKHGSEASAEQHTPRKTDQENVKWHYTLSDLNRQGDMIC